MLSNPDAYRWIFDHSMDAVLLTAPDGRIVLANQACAGMFGYTVDELCHLGRAAVVDPSDPRLAAALDERRQTGRFRGELTMRRKDGTTFPVEISSAVFRDEHGREWTSMFIRDISDRAARQAERERLVRELDAKRLWLEAVLEHVPLSVLLFEPDGRLKFNRKAEETLGMALSATAGSGQYRPHILFPDGSPVGHDQLVSTRVLENGETINGAEFVVQRGDGSRVPILGAAGPVRDEHGRLIGGIGIFQDVSDRMRADEAIRASERLLNAIFELLPVGVWIADSTGRIVRANKAGIRIWGGARYVDPSRFGEYRAWWADTGKLIEPAEWALARALTRGETSLGEVLDIQCFDGARKTIINSALPLHDDTGVQTGAIVVNEDITLLKQTEAALRRAVQSREEVLEVVAHDLRHPLQVVSAAVHALLLGKPRSRRLRTALSDIDTQVLRMNRLIQDLLDAAQLESSPLVLQRSRIASGRLLHEVWETHAAVASASSRELQRDIGLDLQDISVDLDKIHRVFGNLIDNALKFTARGGTVTLGADGAGGHVRFWVADTGPGMDAESVRHMFTRRWYADPEHRGLGIGLTIAKSIVEAHGGRIWAESTAGTGTTVFFTIPSVAS